MVNVTELRRTPVQLPGMLDLSEDQARRLQVRALVPGEDLARLVPDVEGLAISLTNISFFSFRHLPAQTTIELHFLRDSSAADLEILGDLVALETDEVPYEGRIATRYHYTVVFDRGTERSVDYVLAVLQGHELAVAVTERPDVRGDRPAGLALPAAPPGRARGPRRLGGAGGPGRGGPGLFRVARLARHFLGVGLDRRCTRGAGHLRAGRGLGGLRLPLPGLGRRPLTARR